MKAVIFAGGLGTRLSEETSAIPKPMVEIGGKPMLWHIMKHYSHHGIEDFIICLGYKGNVIKHFFAHYYLTMNDVVIDMRDNSKRYGTNGVESWKVTLVDTGEHTMTGGRLRRVRDYLAGEETFCLTYGDGLADVDITMSVDFHRRHGKLATVTAVHPVERFGLLDIKDGMVQKFKEKPKTEDSYINGGFFVLSPKVLDLVKDDNTVWEKEPLEMLAQRGQLAAFTHNGFWQCIDTQRDKLHANQLWDSGQAPWKVW